MVCAPQMPAEETRTALAAEVAEAAAAAVELGMAVKMEESDRVLAASSIVRRAPSPCRFATCHQSAASIRWYRCLRLLQ